MTPAQMNAALAVHSARSEPIIPSGWKVPNGYTLRGPRGNKKAVIVDHSGNVSDFDVHLWLDGIAYGDRRATSRRDCPLHNRRYLSGAWSAHSPRRALLSILMDSGAARGHLSGWGLFTIGAPHRETVLIMPI